MRTDHQGRVLHQQLAAADVLLAEQRHLLLLEQRAAVIRHLLHAQQVERARQCRERDARLTAADQQLRRCGRCGEWRLPYLRRRLDGSDGRGRVLGRRTTEHRCVLA